MALFKSKSKQAAHFINDDQVEKIKEILGASDVVVLGYMPKKKGIGAAVSIAREPQQIMKFLKIIGQVSEQLVDAL